MYKKQFPILFLLLLICMPLFFAAYSIIGKIAIEYEMEEKLETENLQVLTVDAASVVWLKQNKELLIDGQPFDIKKVTRNGNKITVWGLYDAQEKALKEKILAYQNQNGKSSSSHNAVLFALFVPYFPPTGLPCTYTPFFSQAERIWANYLVASSNPYNSIVKPPPRVN